MTFVSVIMFLSPFLNQASPSSAPTTIKQVSDYNPFAEEQVTKKPPTAVRIFVIKNAGIRIFISLLVLTHPIKN